MKTKNTQDWGLEIQEAIKEIAEFLADTNNGAAQYIIAMDLEQAVSEFGNGWIYHSLRFLKDHVRRQKVEAAEIEKQLYSELKNGPTEDKDKHQDLVKFLDKLNSRNSDLTKSDAAIAESLQLEELSNIVSTESTRHRNPVKHKGNGQDGNAFNRYDHPWAKSNGEEQSLDIHSSIDRIQHDDEVAKEELDNIGYNAVDARLRPLYENLKGAGLKSTLHGVLYQLSLLTLVASRAHREKKRFYLSSEASEFGKFDDLVIDYGDGITFLQVKHSSTPQAYASKHFCDLDDGDASLGKYFDSWCKLKTSAFCRQEGEKGKQSKYIFFTNRSIDKWDAFLKPYGVEQDEFLFTGLDTKTFKFKEGNTRSKFIEAIKRSSKIIKKATGHYTEEDFKKAKQYLEKQYNQREKNNHREKHKEGKKIIINGRSQLSKAQQELIRIALREDGDSENDIAAKMKLHRDCKEWLRENIKPEYTEEDFEKVKQYLENTYKSRKNHPEGEKIIISNSGISKAQKKLIPIALMEDGDSENDIAAKIKLHRDCKEWWRSNTDLPYMDAEEAAIEINEFLNAFVIKVEQPGQSKLPSIINEELKADTNVSSTELFYSLTNCMLDWLSDRNKCSLSSEDYDKLVASEIGNINRFYLLGATQIYEGECKNSDYLDKANLQIDGLIQFLSNKNDDNVAIIEDEGINGAKLFIYQAIKALKTNYQLKDADWVFLNINSPHIHELTSVLKNKTTQFIIIDCRAGLTDNLHNICEHNKKVLLIIRNEQRVQIKIAKYLEFKVPILSDKQVLKICRSHENKQIYIAGKEYTFSQILKEENGIHELMKNLDWLDKILTSNTEKPSKITTLGMPYDVYIPNDLVKGIPLYGLFDLLESVQAAIFIVEGMEYGKLRDALSKHFNKERNQEVITHFTSSIKNDEESLKYRLVKDVNYEPKVGEKLIFVPSEVEVELDDELRTYIHLNICNPEKLEATILDNPKNLQLSIPRRYDFKGDSTAEAHEKPELSLISAKAGFGKSSYCLNDRNLWIKGKQGASTHFWVIKINLPRLKFKKIDPSLMSAFTQVSTDCDWQDWQLQALSLDMEKQGLVKLLLDGFDEIKDKEDINRFNSWLSKLPASVDVIITTRPYAANKVALPEMRSLDNYLTLKTYNEQQHREYIKQYLRAIVEENNVQDRDAVDNMAQDIYELIVRNPNKKMGKLLGIPLESYIFCEALKPHIFKYAKEKFDIKDVFNGNQLNIVTLYQRFIEAKLRIFLQKHMGILEEVTLRLSHRVYGFTASYNDILMVFAYKQAFNLPYSAVDKNLRNTHYTKEMIEELPDTGLVVVETEDKEYFLKFNHETYQEYFAALFILKSLINKKDRSYEKVRKIILDARYRPKYRTIMVMASGISMAGDPMLPGWNNENDEQIKNFWGILFESGDIMGGAIKKLFQDCNEVLSTIQQERLEKIIKNEGWLSEDMWKSIKQQTEEAQNEVEMESEDFEDEVPILIRERAQEPFFADFDEKGLKERLMVKEKVVDETKQVLASGRNPTMLASIFCEIIDEGKLNSYWDIDGGFQAMSLLGNAFNDVLAGYFITRINDDASWREKPAQRAIQNLLATKGLKDEAYKACLDVVFCLLRKSSDLLPLLNILRISSHNAFQMLAENININFSLKIAEQEIANSMKSGDRNNLCSLSNALCYLYSSLSLAFHLKYAAIVDEGYSSITFIYDSETTVKVNDDSMRKIFQETIKKISGIAQKYNSYILKNSGACDIPSLYLKASQLCSIDQDACIALANHQDWKYKSSYWPINSGILLTGFVGKFFNNLSASNLIRRAEMWTDNKNAAVESLEMIYSSLAGTAIEDRDENYKNAVIVYNKTIMSFPGYDLEKIADSFTDLNL
jgi:hypothetical protein